MKGVLGVTVQVDQYLETLFRTLHQPVYGAFFVGLQVPLPENVEQVLAQMFAKALLQKTQVLRQRLRTSDHLEKFLHPHGHIVFKPLVVEQGQDAVVVGREGGVLAGVEALVPAVGVDEARRVQAVAAHHAADGVGDQLLHGVLAEAGPLLLFGELAAVAVGGVHREGDLLDGDVGGELVRQAVGVDEEAVVLLFEALHLGDGVLVLGDPGGVAGFEGGRRV